MTDSSRRLSCAKEKSSGVENGIKIFLFAERRSSASSVRPLVTEISGLWKRDYSQSHTLTCSEHAHSGRNISKSRTVNRLRELCQQFVHVMYQSNRSLNIPPGHLNFWKIFVQIPPSRGRKAVQMPHYRSIPGGQMPPPMGNFSVASIVLRKLCM